MKTSRLFLLYLSWVGSILATIGSIIYSDLLLVPICPLCWYQRIAMYPLVVIYVVGILLKDKRSVYYALPLILAGFFLSLYQVLLQAQIIPNLLAGCAIGISCAEVTYRLFGLITIPQQALLGFAALGFLNILIIKLKD